MLKYSKVLGILAIVALLSFEFGFSIGVSYRDTQHRRTEPTDVNKQPENNQPNSKGFYKTIADQMEKYATHCAAQPQSEPDKWLHKAICDIRSTDVVIAFFSGLLVLVTIGLIIVGTVQAAIAYTTTRAQLRAHVVPESALIVDGMMLKPPLTTKSNEPGVVLTWKNTGQTPASNVVSWGQIAVIERTNESQLIVPPLQNIFSAHLGAGAVSSKSLWFGRALTPQEIADVASGNRGIYLYGRIEYRDIFKKPRWTNYRLIYSGLFPPPEGVVFNVCIEGNDAA